MNDSSCCSRCWVNHKQFFTGVRCYWGVVIMYLESERIKDTKIFFIICFPYNFNGDDLFLKPANVTTCILTCRIEARYLESVWGCIQEYRISPWKLYEDILTTFHFLPKSLIKNIEKIKLLWFNSKYIFKGPSEDGVGARSISSLSSKCFHSVIWSHCG